MKAIYFPATFITEKVLDTLTACFSQVVVYQPALNRIPKQLQEREDQERLEIRTPRIENDNDLDNLLRAYRSWADLHQGQRLDLNKFQSPDTPFFEETSSLRIRSDIRNAMKRSKEAAPPENRHHASLLIAMLFLTMAQEFDQNQDDLSRDFERLSSLEKDLFQNLKADHDDPFNSMKAVPSDDVDGGPRYMPVERLSAWTRLFFHDRYHPNSLSEPDNEPFFFITDSKSAFDILMGQATETEQVLSLSGITPAHTRGADAPPFSNKINQNLELMATTDQKAINIRSVYPSVSNSSAARCRLTVFRVSGEAPMAFLSRCTDVLPREKEPVDTCPCKHTLIGLIEAESPSAKSS